MTTAAPASLRDPAGRLVERNGRLLRLVYREAAATLRAFAATEQCTSWVRAGVLPRTRTLAHTELESLAEEPGIALVLEHERIGFPSYPYEWSPEMLCAAGELTLELAEATLENGFGLKDATPYNVLFRGPRPVFVDWLSFERRDPHDPLWLPYAQFVRTFLLPLVAERDFGVPLAWSLGAQRDGIEPQSVYRMSSRLGRLRRPNLELATLPTWLGRRRSTRGEDGRRAPRMDPNRARFVLRSTLRRLSRQLRAASPREDRRSAWSQYDEGEPSYEREQFQAKERFVLEVLRTLRPRRVLDVGCNTGHFSLLSARTGASVVAVDADPVVVGRSFRRARREELDVMPLVVDLARPSPAHGWRNGETLSFLDRARGHADLVLMLAVLHHLLVSGGIPLDEILALAAELTRDSVVVEFVEPSDPMFRRLCKGRDDLHAGLDTARFEAAARLHFEIVRSEQLPGAKRRLYYLRKRT